SLDPLGQLYGSLGLWEASNNATQLDHALRSLDRNLPATHLPVSIQRYLHLIGQQTIIHRLFRTPTHPVTRTASYERSQDKTDTHAEGPSSPHHVLPPATVAIESPLCTPHLE